MRILQLAPPWFAVPPHHYGGIEGVVASLADGLVDAGHDVTLFASRGSATKAHLRSVYPVPPSAQLGDTFTELAHVLAAYDTADDYDVIHDHTGLGVALGYMLPRPPVVHTLHGPWSLASSRVYRRLGRRVHLVAISHDQATRAPPGVRLAGVVRNGIQLERYPPGRHEGGYLAFVGRASPEKGPEIAVEVARRLRLPLRMAIKINEPDEHRYWETVIRPGIGDADVEILPPLTLSEKAALFGDALVTLFPIAWPEPFGLVMAESNACGTPVVAFAEGGAPEVLAHGRTGVLVSPGDIDAFCDAVDVAARLDPADCRQHVVDHFTAGRMVADYLHVYERAIHFAEPGRGARMTSGGTPVTPL